MCEFSRATLCAKRMDCLRYTAFPDDWQSFSDFQNCKFPDYDNFLSNKGYIINPKINQKEILKMEEEDDKNKQDQ